MLPMERLLTRAPEDSTTASDVIISGNADSQSTFSSTAPAKDNQEITNSSESKLKLEKLVTITDPIDAVLDVGQGQVLTLPAGTAGDQQQGALQVQNPSGERAITLPAGSAGYQIVAANPDSFLSSVTPTTELPTCPNMETISASAVMLMTTSYFPSPSQGGNSQS